MLSSQFCRKHRVLRNGLFFILFVLLTACSTEAEQEENQNTNQAEVDAGDVNGTPEDTGGSDANGGDDPDANGDDDGPEVALYIYDDALTPPWIDASWDTTVDLEATGQVFSGTHAIEAAQEHEGALSFRHGDWSDPDQNLDAEEYGDLSFELYSEDSLEIDVLLEGDGTYSRVDVGTIPAGAWTNVTVPVSDLVIGGGDFRRVNILEVSGSTVTYFVDYVRLYESEEDDDGGSENGGTDPLPGDEFVTIDPDNPRFLVDGEPFYFAGTNLYWLFQRYTYGESDVVDDAFEMAEDMGLRVIRTWGFADGHAWTDSTDPAILQSSPGEFNESTFEALDYVVAKAAEHGVRLIIPLVNYWSAYGGMLQYAEWAGGTDREYFYTNSEARQLYKDYVYEVLTRENTITGVEYRDDPTIMAWQPANEARAPFDDDADNDILVDWYIEMAAYIRSIDSNHLVATGEEGWEISTYSDDYSDNYTNNYAISGAEGSSFTENTALDDISFGQAHLYPDVWGFSDAVADGERWIVDHVDIAHDNDKPFVLGEFGNDDRSVYADWLQVIEDNDVAGSLMWQIVPASRGRENEMTIVYPDDTELVELFSDHAAVMNAK